MSRRQIIHPPYNQHTRYIIKNTNWRENDRIITINFGVQTIGSSQYKMRTNSRFMTTHRENNRFTTIQLKLFKTKNPIIHCSLLIFHKHIPCPPNPSKNHTRHSILETRTAKCITVFFFPKHM